MKEYRIHWRAVKTTATGHSTGTFPKEQAEVIAKQLNKKTRMSLFTG